MAASATEILTHVWTWKSTGVKSLWLNCLEITEVKYNGKYQRVFSMQIFKWKMKKKVKKIKSGHNQVKQLKQKLIQTLMISN